MTQTPLPAAPAPMPPGPAPSAPERAITPGTLIAVAVLTVLLAASWFWADVLLLVFAAVLIAVALRAGAGMLHRWLGLNVKIGVIVVILAVIGALAAVGRVAGQAVAEQFAELAASVPEAWAGVNDWLSSSEIGTSLQEQIEDAPDMTDRAAEMAQRLPDLFQTLSGAVNATVGSVFSIFLMLILALYIAMEAERYREGTIMLVPLRHRDRAGNILDEMGRNLALWMGGQALDMLAVAILAGLGLWMLGVPLAFILALIAGLTNIIPIVGPFLSGTIAVLFSFTQGFELAVQVAILFIVIQLIDGEIILPMIQRFAVSLPPALTVVGIMAFGGLFGLVGILLATPLLVILIVLVRRVYVEDVLGDRLPD